MGDWLEIYRGLHASRSFHSHDRLHGFQHGLLGLALKVLPVGTAYAVWTGVGSIGTALLGIYLFQEPATVARLICIGLIVAGIGGLKVVG
jgi:multidrug transporter EmrE-like cation transporter